MSAIVKKTVGLILVLMVSFSLWGTAGAEGEVSRAALDAAFAAGQIRLSEVPRAGLMLDKDQLFLSAEYQAQMAEHPEWLDMAIENAYVLSVSPNGESALLVSGDVALIWRSGAVRELQPSQTRGVADEFGNFEKMTSKGLLQGLAQAKLQEITWSPDGRYASVTCYESVIINARMYADPYLIDCDTGEIFMVATYSSKFLREKAGAPVAACFSADGRYVYYMVYGSIGGTRSTLIRYDLEKEKLETCCSVSDTDYYPMLAELRDGSLIMIKDVRKAQDRVGLSHYVPFGTSWMYFEQPFRIHRSKWPAKKLVYSRASGYALITDTEGRAFIKLKPDESLSAGDEFYTFSSETGELVTLTAEDMLNMPDVGSKEGNQKMTAFYDSIQDVCLSPDGHYAMFLTVFLGQPHMRLVSLDDMRQVEASDILETQLSMTMLTRGSMIWQGDMIIFGTMKQTRSYQFQYAQ